MSGLPMISPLLQVHQSTSDQLNYVLNDDLFAGCDTRDHYLPYQYPKLDPQTWTTQAGTVTIWDLMIWLLIGAHVIAPCVRMTIVVPDAH